MSIRLFVAVAAAILALPAHAETIAVIGTGDVAKALGPAFAKQGHTILAALPESGARQGQGPRREFR